MLAVDYAPGMRTIIRDEEWMVKKVERNNMGNDVLYCIGVSPLVKDREVIFLEASGMIVGECPAPD